MSRKQTAQEDVKKARALVDLYVYGYDVPCGAFFVAPAPITDVLVGYGVADPDAQEAAVYGDEIPDAHVITKHAQEVE